MVLDLTVWLEELSKFRLICSGCSLLHVLSFSKLVFILFSFSLFVIVHITFFLHQKKTNISCLLLLLRLLVTGYSLIFSGEKLFNQIVEWKFNTILQRFRFVPNFFIFPFSLKLFWSFSFVYFMLFMLCSSFFFWSWKNFLHRLMIRENTGSGLVGRFNLSNFPFGEYTWHERSSDIVTIGFLYRLLLCRSLPSLCYQCSAKRKC